MEQVEKYIRKHHDHMIQIFKSMSAANQQLQATKVFTYIKNSFNNQILRFMLNNKNFFDDEDNTSIMQKILENYYLQNNQNNDKKFYLYRVKYQYEEIGDIIQFWIKMEPNLKIIYNQQQDDPTHKLQQQHQNNKNDKIQQVQKQDKSDNQFDISCQNIPAMIQQHHQQIKQYENKANDQQISQTQKQLYSQKIKDLKIKIQVLQQTQKTNSISQQQKTKQNRITKSLDLDANNSPEKSSKTKGINYKALFNFYAKQQYSTGGKPTFQRIQRQSKSINYQKLIHFLRQYQLIPKKAANNKKLHLLYIKNCNNSRTLNQQGFLTVLLGVMSMQQPNKSQQQLKQLLDNKIIIKSKKDNKLYHNPFHIPQKQDFRINSNDINYNFKILPQFGKFQDEIIDTLEQRRREKLEAKEEKELQRKSRKIKYLKRLQAIDPYNQQLIKNAQLLSERSRIQQEPIASLDNIQRYRDSSFDLQKYLGITQDKKQHPSNNKRYQRNLSLRSQQSYKKAQRLQKYEAQKMKNLMNGLIQRSNAKMEKLGIPPNKAVKFN